MRTFTMNEERFAALEQSNRRLKAGMMVLVGMATMFAILGAAAPVPQILEANKFVLRDISGTKRAELAMDDNIPVMRMFNPNGSIALELASGQTGNGLWLRDDKGNQRATLDVGPSEAVFGFSSGKDISFMLSNKPDETKLAMYDIARQPRLVVDYARESGPSLSMFGGKRKYPDLSHSGMGSHNKRGWNSQLVYEALDCPE